MRVFALHQMGIRFDLLWLARGDQAGVHEQDRRRGPRAPWPWFRVGGAGRGRRAARLDQFDVPEPLS